MTDLISISDMAIELERIPDTVKHQLHKLGIRPKKYIGTAGMYEASAIEAIREVPSVGRPKKSATQPEKPKPKGRKQKDK
jgi:hypothetical protein